MAGKWSNKGAARAKEAREELGYAPDEPLPCVLEAVEDRGGAHVAVLAFPDGLAGAYVDKPGLPLLFVNGTQALTRQRFTLAHEFGHYRMKHASVVDRFTTIGGVQRDSREIAANAFAAEFLMPCEGTRAWAEVHVTGQVNLEDVVRFAAEYGVSPQAARYAFETAGVLTSTARCDQLDAEIADDLHIKIGNYLAVDPVDDGLADANRRLPRIPPAIEGKALGDLLVGAIDVDGLAVRAGHPVEKVEASLQAFHLDELLPVG